jgi:hypothetical protein
MRIIATFLVALISIGGADACEPLTFGGKGSGSASGATDRPFPCFDLSVPAGKKVTVRVTSSAKDMAFNILDVVDNQDRFTFTASKPQYRIEVYRTFNGPPAKFEITAR